MSSTPWSVQRTKRKQQVTTPTSRKRVRTSDDVSQKKSKSTRSKDQQTLTQIQWVNSPSTSFVDDQALEEIGPGAESSLSMTRSNSRVQKARDSTLTQMDWLGGIRVRRDDTSDDMALLPESTNVKQSMPQLDGMYDSPRKRRKRRAKAQSAVANGSSDTSIEQDTQEYKPSKTRKQDSDSNTRLVTPQRKSRRIASKVLSDSKENYPSIDQSPLPRKVQPTGIKPQRKPVLEVMDSTEFYDDLTPRQTHPQLPSTPKRRSEIPSSQTPETVKTSKKTVRQHANSSPSRTFDRTPLSERSTNVTFPASHKVRNPMKGMSNIARTSRERGKICILKVPGRALLQRSGYVDDSQRDVYSIHGTSSSGAHGQDSDSQVEFSSKALSKDKSDEALEIQSTGEKQNENEPDLPSSPPEAATEESLPELSDLISAGKDNAVTGTQLDLNELTPYHQADSGDSVVVRDFGTPNPHRTEESAAIYTAFNAQDAMMDNEPMLLDHDNQNVASPSLPIMSNIEDDDNDSDFGPPVANDTQFNIGLVERTSTPDLTPKPKNAIQSAEPWISDEREAQENPNENTTINQEIDQERQHVAEEARIPTPKLIHDRNSQAYGLEMDGNHLPMETHQPKPAPYHSTHLQSTTTVPLNDIDQIPSSSSPLLPPFRPMAQHRIHPASLPRPSQVSTQEPTQHYMLSSMVNPTQHEEIDKIMIKDSSPTHLSQIPQHQTQTRGLNLRRVNVSDDDFDDIDLDPSSTPHGRQSARKPTFFLRKETGSSLRSIHVSSDKSKGSSERGSDPIRPSSPIWQAAEVSKTVKNTKSKSAGTSGTLANLQPPTGPQQIIISNVDHNDDYSDLTSSPTSSPEPPALKGTYKPIPGFDNDTQSNFTQNGHITAAYIHRQRATGAWPDWFVPEPFQVPNFKRPSKGKEKGKQKNS